MGAASSIQKWIAPDRTQEKVEYLKNTPFFLVMEEKKLVEFSKFCDISEVPSGSELKTHAFVVVAKGVLSISTLIQLDEVKQSRLKVGRKISNKNLIKEVLCTKTTGDFFSKATREVAGDRVKVSELLNLTTVRALEDTTVLTLTHKNLRKYISNNSEDRQLLDSVLRSDLLTKLKTVPFLKELSDVRLAALSELFSFETHEPGKKVFCEGDESNSLYIVLEGELAVVANLSEESNGKVTKRNLLRNFTTANFLKTQMSDGAMLANKTREVEEENRRQTVAPEELAEKRSFRTREIQLAILRSGSYFGEMAMLVNMKRSATVVTRTKCLFLSLQREHFFNFIKVEPTLKEKLESHAMQRMLMTLSAFNIPFFRELKNEKIRDMAKVCTLVESNCGDIIVKEGEFSDGFYIIFHGSVGIYKASTSENVVNHLGVGQYFGEIAMVTGEKRIATAKVTSERAVLLKILWKGFSQYFLQSKDQLAEFEMKVMGHNMRLKQVIVHPFAQSCFHSYLKSEFNAEHLDFWAAADLYSHISSQQERKTLANTILEAYFAKNATHPINIDDDKRKQVLERFAAGDVGVDLFQNAADEIYQVLDRDNFERFKRSKVFKELLTKIGVYDLDTLQDRTFDASAKIGQRMVTSHAILDHLEPTKAAM